MRWWRELVRFGPTILLWLGITLFAVYFSWLSDVKASNFDAHNHDLSHMWQSVWNVAHGRGFEFSLTGSDFNVPRLAVHADYFLILLAPLSWVWPHYTVLLVVQAVGVALGAWFVERLARRWTGSRAVALVFAGAYLLSGPLQFALLWNFHSIALAPLFIFATIEALVNHRRRWLLWTWLILALITKEQVGLILGPLLWMIARWTGERRLGWWLGGAAVTYALIQFLFIIPLWRDSGNSHFVWEFYYGSLGATPAQQFIGLLNPREIISRLWQTIHLKTMILLLLPLAGLPLLTPLSLLAMVAILPHWLSDDPSQHALLSTNHILALTILFINALRVVSLRIRRRQWRARSIALVIAGASIIGSIVMSPFPWSVYGDPAMRRVDPAVKLLRAKHQLIPPAAVVGYSLGAGAEFRDRPFAWLLPRGLSTLEYAVVFTSERTSTRPPIVDQDRRLNEFFRSTSAFETVYTQGRLSIYHRNPAIPLPPPSDLELHLVQ